MFRILSLTALLLTFTLPAPLQAQEGEQDWAAIDRMGTMESSSLGSDIWKGYSQEKAMESLYRLPPHLSNKTYREIVKGMLLTTSKPTSEKVSSPALLTLRLQMLMHYGFIAEARELISLISENYDFNDDLNMAVVKLQMALMDGDLAPACLDIQAYSAQFQDVPSWRELSQYCRFRFGTSESGTVDDAQFRYYPSLKPLLTGAKPDFAQMKDVEIFIADADKRLFDDESYTKAARKVGTLPDLLVLKAIDPVHTEKKGYQCYAIEAVKRGLRDDKFLQTSYKKAPFPETALSDSGGEIKLHPCDVPAFFYQKITGASGDANVDHMLNAMLKTTESIPAAALSPFIPYLAEKSKIEPQHHWRTAVIIASNGKDIPESFLPAAIPLKAIQESRKMSENDYIKWANVSENEQLLEAQKIDIAAPLYILQIINGDFNKLTNSKGKNIYENIFSLTYEKNSLNLGLGFTGFMTQIVKNDDMITALSRALNLMGDNDLSAYSLEDVAVILSAFEAYKLEKESVALAFEYLQ